MDEPTLPALPARISPEFARAVAARRPSVSVVGDVILDGWWTGRIERMSREAPAPVVEIAHRQFAPGGAANTAMTLAALGARVRLVGIVGDDEAGIRLRSLVAAAGIDVRYLISDPAVCTTAKNRVVAGDQILMRIDDVPAPPPADLRARLAEAAVTASVGVDAEIISDYGTGIMSEPVRQALAARSSRPPLCVVDAHDLRSWRSLAADIVTPNAAELERALGTPIAAGRPRAEAVAEIAASVLEATGAHAAVVTLDRDGTVTVAGNGDTFRTFAHPTLERQASGAGDTFVAALTAAVACGAGLTTAAEFAQAAADIVVQRAGTAVCSTADLVERLGHPADPSIGIDELQRRLAVDRAAGQRIVFTNGCFDVLHRGHTTSLRQAKLLGGVLVVAVNDDDSVRRLKGPGRPVNRASDRAAVLASLECVDYVTIFDTDTPVPLLERLRPDVYAKGGDYTPDMLDEAETVRSYGGEVRILDYIEAQSTTAVVGRIRSGQPPLASESGAR